MTYEVRPYALPRSEQPGMRRGWRAAIRIFPGLGAWKGAGTWEYDPHTYSTHEDAMEVAREMATKRKRELESDVDHSS